MKGSFQDIKPATRKRAVPQAKPEPRIEAKPEVPREIPRVRNSERYSENVESVARSRERYIPSTPFEGHHRQSFGRMLFSVVGLLVVLLAAIYGISYFFRTATVEITPKSITGTVNVTLTATNDGSTGIQYQLMTVPETLTQTVTATDTTVEAAKATGTVILYNFQTTAEKLVAGTRFTDANGTLFRLQDPVTVPKKTISGGTDIPGQATVTFVADAAGPSGNIPLSDFSLVAFQGTSKAKLFYGRSKTVFTGGTSGPAYYLSSDDYATIESQLSQKVSSMLHDESYKQVPDGYILLSDSLTFIPDPNAAVTPSPSTSPDIPVSYTGKMRGILLKKSDLESAFISNVAPEETVTPDQVSIVGESALAYQSNAGSSSAAAVPNAVSVTITGDVTIVWNIDQTLVKAKLLNADRSSFSSLMQSFVSVKEADLALHPFWMEKLPSKPEKITILVDNPAAR